MRTPASGFEPGATSSAVPDTSSGVVDGDGPPTPVWPLLVHAVAASARLIAASDQIGLIALLDSKAGATAGCDSRPRHTDLSIDLCVYLSEMPAEMIFSVVRGLPGLPR